MSVVSWWAGLRVLAAINITVWILSAISGDHDPASMQLALSGVYVFGCAFRSFLPVYDIPRICMVDTWASSVLVGRSVATLAELAFAAQWAVYLHGSELEWVRALSLTIVPLIVIAQICCWHAVLTTSNRGHIFENSLWGISAALIVTSLVAIASHIPASPATCWRCGWPEARSTSHTFSSSMSPCIGHDGKQTRRWGGSI